MEGPNQPKGKLALSPFMRDALSIVGCLCQELGRSLVTLTIASTIESAAVTLMVRIRGPKGIPSLRQTTYTV